MIIQSKNFILRPVRRGDEVSIVKNINNKKISKNTATIPYPYTMEDAKGWIREKINQYKNKNSSDIVWGIEIDGEICGAIGLHEIVPGHKGELGYWIGEKFWGRGIMTEATKLVCNYGFKKLKLKRIWAKVYVFNTGSKRVLEKSGFALEGICRKEAKKGNKYIDAYLLAKIK
ncbi:MAG: GNAT family N-acetyltransferase [Candidatus Moraniibacteriota bacterium]